MGIILYFLINKYDKKIEFINIPKTIYITSKTKVYPAYVYDAWKKLNPNYNIIHFDNYECIKFLADNFDQEHIDIFNFIQDGPIKADFFRTCIIYLNGGVYADIDIKPLVPIDNFLEKDVSLLTCASITKDKLNPHIIIAPPKHPVMKDCLELYLEYYRNKKKYSYWGYSIVTIMSIVMRKYIGHYVNNDGIYYDKYSNKYQIIKETWKDKKTLNNVYCEYKNKILLYNRFENYDAVNHTYK
jgi:mannosyltransferase OCH1-like enzyme